jgi:membrane protein insertase Oxa1/YidC/SpoIIIJ
MYYLPILLISAISFYVFRKSESKLYLLVKSLNLIVILTIIYSLILGLYFMTFYMGEIREYPSLTISTLAVPFLIYVIIPLDILTGLYYFWQKFKTQRMKHKSPTSNHK